MSIIRYFKARGTREDAFGIIAYLAALILSVSYLWSRLPFPATIFFSFATADTADRVARWFGRG